MSDSFPFQDLTPLVEQAHRGLKRDVAPLVEAIPEGGFFVSLARSLGLPDEFTLPDPEASLSSHMIQHPDGSVYVAFFTRPELVKVAQEQQEWRSDKGTAEIAPVQAKNALFYAWKLISNNENVVGLILNPFQEKAIMLNRLEIESLFNGVAVPFEAYATQVPFEEGDGIMVRPADVSSVEGFAETVDEFRKNHAAIEGYEVVALFDEQRNMEPYLAINFKAEMDASQYPEAAQQFVALLQKKINFPERLEIMFNEKFPTLI